MLPQPGGVHVCERVQVLVARHHQKQRHLQGKGDKKRISRAYTASPDLMDLT